MTKRWWIGGSAIALLGLAAAALAIESGAAFAVGSMTQAVDTVSKMVENRAALEVAREGAVQFAKSHQGATEKTVAAVAQLIG